MLIWRLSACWPVGQRADRGIWHLSSATHVDGSPLGRFAAGDTTHQLPSDKFLHTGHANAGRIERATCGLGGPNRGGWQPSCTLIGGLSPPRTLLPASLRRPCHARIGDFLRTARFPAARRCSRCDAAPARKRSKTLRFSRPHRKTRRFWAQFSQFIEQWQIDDEWQQPWERWQVRRRMATRNGRSWHSRFPSTTGKAAISCCNSHDLPKAPLAVNSCPRTEDRTS